MMLIKYTWAGFLLCVLGILSSCQEKHKNELVEKILGTDGLVALWDFSEKAGKQRKALGLGDFPLAEANGKIGRTDEGPISGYAAKLDSGNFFMLPWEETGALNIYGKDQGVTVISWVKWSGKVSCFVGGMWNEYQDGGKRQYGLFVSLPHYNGGDQVCGHISRTGKPTPPFPYSIDYSASRQVVPVNEWVCVAFSYDGEYMRSYLNGVFESRKPEQIDNTTGFEGYPDGLVQSKNPYHYPDGMGNNGSDFTVGAVLVKGGMGNYFKGQIGGLAVFDRALSDEEMKGIAIVPDFDGQ